MSRDLVVALSGGIGGAKLALGLSRILPADNPLAVWRTSRTRSRRGGSLAALLDQFGTTVKPGRLEILYKLLGWRRARASWRSMQEHPKSKGGRPSKTVPKVGKVSKPER
jgi:LPPG:FO 2-phospho-L-lactate transferase